jgi:hypothetical protein
MADFLVSSKELERQALMSFEGRDLTVMLCNNSALLTENSTLANWLTQEISGNGYARHVHTLTNGAFIASQGYYQFQSFIAEFTCTGPSSLVYSNVILFLDGEAYPYAVATEVPTTTLVPGKSKSYSMSIRLGT